MIMVGLWYSTCNFLLARPFQQNYDVVTLSVIFNIHVYILKIVLAGLQPMLAYGLMLSVCLSVQPSQVNFAYKFWNLLAPAISL